MNRIEDFIAESKDVQEFVRTAGNDTSKLFIRINGKIMRFESYMAYLLKNFEKMSKIELINTLFLINKEEKLKECFFIVEKCVSIDDINL